MFRRLYLPLAALGISIASAHAQTPVWVEVRSSHFRVLSDAGEPAARRAAALAEGIGEAYRRHWPDLPSETHGAVTVLLFAHASTFREWQAAGPAEPHLVRAEGVFRSGEHRQYIAIPLEGGQQAALIGHEYFHLVAARNFPGIPLWLGEGLAEYFGATELGDSPAIGAVRAEHVALLRSRPWIPLAELFATTKDSPYYTDDALADLLYAESWAVVHYLMGAGQPDTAIEKLLFRLRQGAPLQEAELFGDLDRLQSRVEQHIRDAAGSSGRVLAGPTLVAAQGSYPVRVLAAAEVSAVRGDYLLHAGKNAEAEAAFADALGLDPPPALALEGMGMLRLQQERPEEAAGWFARAVALGSSSPLAHYYHAVLVAAEAKNAAALRTAEQHLQMTVQLDSQFARAYAALAGIYLLRGEHQEAQRMAERAAQLEPGEPAHRIDLARILARRGDLDGARRLAHQILAESHDAKGRTRAEGLLEHLAQYEIARDAVAALERELAERAAHPPQPVERELPAEAAEPRWRTSQRPPRQAYTWGTIIGVRCTAPSAMHVQVDSHDGPLTLRALNYRIVAYYVSSGPPPQKFDPCRQLAGAYAGFVFRPVRGQSHEGEVLAIEMHTAPAATR
jgi:tetratricopeptide (TPR) repeat protein